jgi:hypothetical protein
MYTAITVHLFPPVFAYRYRSRWVRSGADVLGFEHDVLQQGLVLRVGGVLD